MGFDKQQKSVRGQNDGHEGPQVAAAAESSTRRNLVAVAERLFAEKGLDGVSLVEICLEADQKNRSAVQYHFGDKAGLIAAIRDKHRPAVERRRIDWLDTLEANEKASLRDFINALVYPLAEELLEPDGGASFVRVNAGLIGHPQYSPMSRDLAGSPTAARLLAHIVRTGPKLPRDTVGPRMLLVTVMLFHGLADWARLQADRQGINPTDWEVFVGNLVDSIVSVLEKPAGSRASWERRREP